MYSNIKKIFSNTAELLYGNRNISLLHTFFCTAVEIFLYHTIQNSFQHSNRIISILHKFSCTAVEIFPTTPEHLHSNRNISLPHKFSFMYSNIKKIFSYTAELLYGNRNISLLHKFFCTAVEIFSYHTRTSFHSFQQQEFWKQVTWCCPRGH